MGYTKEYTRTHEHVLGQRERNALRDHAFKRHEGLMELCIYVLFSTK